jgi:hypothetical protein
MEFFRHSSVSCILMPNEKEDVVLRVFQTCSFHRLSSSLFFSLSLEREQDKDFCQSL